MSLLEQLDNHKVGATFTAIGSYMTGVGAGHLQDYHMPPIFLESLQALAYTTSIFVGAITIFAWSQKKFKEWLRSSFYKKCKNKLMFWK